MGCGGDVSMLYAVNIHDTRTSMKEQMEVH